MTNDKTKKAGATDGPYDVIYFAKKHRISNEDARDIVEKYGTNRKEADKAGRRISA
ncbi:hypothetical protein GGE16_000913 [Rhizobium leguminosarum]|uniref:DUF3606 domain-containing protein n=1 Tax=Rhizobium leguminosarum TaxID=384 RepID=A0AAE2SUW2_RHILE|nr:MULTISPECIES: DUF3606 domain-containing protein [Rhizobium]MBB4288897.1 hypothetical protein [Rhizobium leguminosarum]MBB4295010.1 hypothetical protein [Rhizobium leguminosarum]MBB4306403.1 hypothetical protein [Rhizobium leguminosarum]MBB4418016.1 hypothetical protein [Rhizobium leguminosarum]MBB4432861.1 hypothetical protein [Rhizobium esperanzae]